jgi:hypothetical protein
LAISEFFFLTDIQEEKEIQIGVSWPGFLVFAFAAASAAD